MKTISKCTTLYRTSCPACDKRLKFQTTKTEFSITCPRCSHSFQVRRDDLITEHQPNGEKGRMEQPLTSEVDDWQNIYQSPLTNAPTINKAETNSNDRSQSDSSEPGDAIRSLLDSLKMFVGALLFLAAGPLLYGFFDWLDWGYFPRAILLLPLAGVIVGVISIVRMGVGIIRILRQR